MADGPVPVSEELVRTETRFALPIGLGIAVSRADELRKGNLDLTFGVVPWWVVASDADTCEAPCLRYEAEKGTSRDSNPHHTCDQADKSRRDGIGRCDSTRSSDRSPRRSGHGRERTAIRSCNRACRCGARRRWWCRDRSP